MKFRFIALLIVGAGLAFARMGGGVTTGSFSSNDAGDEYIQLSPTGLVTILTQAESQPVVLSGSENSPVAVHQVTLSTGERVLSQPYFYERASNSGENHIFFFSALNGVRRLWSVACDENLNCSSSVLVISAGDTASAYFTTEEGVYFYVGTALKRLDPASLNVANSSLDLDTVPHFATVDADSTGGDSCRVLFAFANG
ncbi:MAG TPA: hypothetical protein VLM37_03740, partial [Fibrobacteraceae bacterium]|nr:hypothetical protein [Fibrobacteraceae bacterium]